MVWIYLRRTLQQLILQYTKIRQQAVSRLSTAGFQISVALGITYYFRAHKFFKK